MQDNGLLDISIKMTGDLDTVKGIDNLKQAIICRLLTRRGERSDKSLGADLYALKGAKNVTGVRELGKVLIYDSLVEEPRLQTVKGMQCVYDPNKVDTVKYSIEVITIKSFVKVDDEGHDYSEGETSYDMNNAYVYSISEVRGFIDGKMMYFRQNADYVQSGDALEWLESGRHPDTNTRFLVDYQYFDLSTPDGYVVPMTFPYNLKSG